MLKWFLENMIIIATSVGVLIISAWAAVALLAKLRETSGQRASRVYASIRGGSVQTLLSLVVGIILSIAVGLLIWWTVFHYSGYILNKPLDIIYYSRHAVGVIIGYIAGYNLVFLQGTLITIEPGQKAYLKLFGIPFGNLGAGWAWIPRGIMDYKIVQSQAHQDSSDGVEEYLTANGMELFVASGATVMIQEPLLAQGIAPGGDITAYITARRKSAVRRFIGEQKLEMDLAFKETPTATEQLQLFKQMVQIKGDISSNGPSMVCNYMNDELKAYGMQVIQVQFGEVLFSDRLEGKIERTFDEIAEGPGLHKDMLNKASQIQTITTQTLSHMGISLESLTSEQKLEILSRNQAYVLAAEGQGGYQFTDFGRAPPRGVMVNTQTNQPQQKGNST